MEQLVEQAYTTFHEEAKRRGIDYRSDLGASPVIVTDGDRVLQIITNLLSNAFRWTPDGGRDRALARRRRTAPSPCASPTRARASGRASASGSSGRSGRATDGGTGPRPPDRERARAGARRPHRARRPSEGTRLDASELVLRRAGAVSRAPQPASRVVAAPAAAAARAAAFAALRPRQWSKNLLLFAGIVFAAKLGDAGRWAEASRSFAAYCAASSAAYLVNDVRDAERRPAAPREARAADRARRAPAARRARARRRARGRGARRSRRRSASASVALPRSVRRAAAAYSLGLKHVVLDRRAARSAACS